MPSLLLRHVRLVPVAGSRLRTTTADPGWSGGPPDAPVDLRLAGGHVVELGHDLPRAPGEDELDGAGRWAIPGLWDQHVHSGQWARSLSRLDLSPATSASETAELVRRQLASAPPAPGDIFEGYGFRDALWPDVPTVALLDAVAPQVPVVLVSGDVHCGWLNSAAQRRLDLPARDGVIREHEWFDLLARLGRLPRPDDGYPRAVARAAARGVVGIVDMEFAANHRDWPQRRRADVDLLRVRTGVYLADLDDVIAAGLRTGTPLPGGGGLLTMGPVKVIIDGALNTRTAYCHQPYADPGGSLVEPAAGDRVDVGELTVPAGELGALMRRTNRAGLELAVHAIGDAANSVALDAFAASGARGTIEHAQLLRPVDIPRFAAQGIVASVQPAHLLDDRDVAEACWPGRADRTFPLRALLDAGATLRFGSDAPVAPLDPWLAMAAAVHRSADRRAPWHPEQQVSVAEALAASTDGWGTLASGHPGDVVLLDADPFAPAADSAEAAARLRSMPVATTILAGRVTHDALSGLPTAG